MAGEISEIADISEVFIVAADPTESLLDIRSMILDIDLPWQPATPSAGLLVDLGIKVQSTKLVLDNENTVVARYGYGGGNSKQWISVLSSLMEQEQQAED
ncbi:MAG: hypothetical protein VYC23_00010 [Chloroflexota bacterium]|nr:hypothetical protein [Chloroflexota bacterium]